MDCHGNKNYFVNVINFIQEYDYKDFINKCQWVGCIINTSCFYGHRTMVSPRLPVACHRHEQWCFNWQFIMKQYWKYDKLMDVEQLDFHGYLSLPWKLGNDSSIATV